jgi:hypothetical protein
MKTPYLPDILRCRPLFYCLDLLVIDLDSLHTHNKTKKNNTVYAKGTFSNISI